MRDERGWVFNIPIEFSRDMPCKKKWYYSSITAHSRYFFNVTFLVVFSALLTNPKEFFGGRASFRRYKQLSFLYKLEHGSKSAELFICVRVGLEHRSDGRAGLGFRKRRQLFLKV